MKTTIALTAALTALTAGAALAVGSAPEKLYGPQPIAEVRAAGQGIVVGTVMHVDRHGFVPADASDRVRVRTSHLAPEFVQLGQQATVVGRMDEGALKAQQIIRDDGTSAQRRDQRRRSRDETHQDRPGDRRGDHRRHHDADPQRPHRR